MQSLSLADLEAFDPSGGRGGRERRYLCPLCHGNRRRDAAHRSLSLNVENGVWLCHRCGESGRLPEHRGKPGTPRRRLRPAQVAAPLSEAGAGSWREHLRGLVPLAGTPGEAYLAGRGVPAQVARTAQVRYHAAFLGRPAVLFPIRGARTELVAVQGRYVDAGEPKCRTLGHKSLGVFLSTPGAIEADPLVITEAPIDALTLAAAGVPAIALCGTSAPSWLAEACALRRVVLALDADAAGDRATSELATELGRYGASLSRLRPPEGYKDWNATLTGGKLVLPAGFDICGACGRPFDAGPLRPPDVETRCPRCR